MNTAILRCLLIAGREFRTYVVTMSFWLSLALVPLGWGAALLLADTHPAPATISIHGGDAHLQALARQALQEAAQLESRNFAFGSGGASFVVLHGAGALTIDFGEKFPLSSAGRAVVGYVMERDLARAAAPAHTLVVRNKSSDNAPDAARLARLAAMAMLWLTLTGSLGMLLQAVVRERANRALESLLASAQSWEIVTGKLLGVGAVSFLILASWLGSTAAYSYLLPQGANAVSAVLAALSSPASLLRNALIYLCAFAFYGTATVALGALARDSAAAQNLARPLFMLLLAGFFVAVGTLGGTHGVSWLGYLPPFTPFLLLVSSPGAVSISAQVLLLGMTLAASLLMTWLAARLLSVSPPTDYIFGRLRSKTQLMV